MFRLYDAHYSHHGNKKSLRVTLRDDNVLSYSFYGGWQDSGMGFAIENLQLQKSLPMSPFQFKNVQELKSEIENVLKTGVGSRHVNECIVLNDFRNFQPQDVKQSLIDRVMEGIKMDIDNGDVTAVEELLGFINPINLIGYLPEDEWDNY